VVHLHGEDGAAQKSLQAIDQVKWIPHWGRERIYGMIENRPDWCVSRQRAWGVPITVFICEKCDAVHMDEAAMNHVFDPVSASTGPMSGLKRYRRTAARWNGL
jgi:isoleucyl-tRNA synthetase